MFDTVYLEVQCPFCKHISEIELQTKDIDKALCEYRIGDFIGTDQYRYIYCYGSCISETCKQYRVANTLEGFEPAGRNLDLHVFLKNGIITGRYRVLNKISDAPELLFLDDIRNPKDVTPNMVKRKIDMSLYQGEWCIVRSYKEFVKVISKKGLPQFISFDHDLGEVNGEIQPSGMDCAKWLVDYCIDNDKELPHYVVHSSNPAGAANINGLFQSFIKRSRK